jgi:hypothetical protein
MTLAVKNWAEFQHYKNRNPPWIKLHKTLLDDPDYAALPPEAAKYLPLVWLVASDSSDGRLPAINKLAFRLRITPDKCAVIIKTLSAWIYDDASKVLAEGKQDATPETEKEAEGEERKEGETETAAKRRSAFVPPTSQMVSDYSREIGYPLDGAAWCDKYQQKGWLVGKTMMKDWKAAVRNWKSSGWKVGKEQQPGKQQPGYTIGLNQ